MIGTTEHYLFSHPDGSALELHTPYPAQWSRLLQLLMAPTRGDMVHTRPRPGGERACGHLVIGLTGSIVAGLMAPVIRSLSYAGFQEHIELILTEAALRFTSRDFFEFCGIRTRVSAFDRRDGVHVPHVVLGQSADCLLVMPASAACCRRLADGAAPILSR